MVLIVDYSNTIMTGSDTVVYCFSNADEDDTYCHPPISTGNWHTDSTNILPCASRPSPGSPITEYVVDLMSYNFVFGLYI